MRILATESSKRLIVCRGLPGSGKSTLARELGKGGVVLGSDDFFMVNGEYKFDFGGLGHAHLWNQGRARKAMSSGISPVVIDNTNITWSDIKPYVRIAGEYGYEVSYAEPDTPWKFDVDELAKRNSHGVPKESLQAYLKKWQPTETLGEEKRASAGVDITGFDKSGRLTQDERDLFAILKDVVARRTPRTTVRVVGGWVRDKLLGTEPKDLDLMVDNIGGPAFAQIVTSSLGLNDPHVIRANPEQSKNIETARMYITLPSGTKLELDVAKARKDVYTEDSRIPDTKDATVEEDASRRDLTINCLFYNIIADEVEDFTGKGISDLNESVIRTPLEPVKTFTDDALRMLRTIRFAARYGWKIAPETQQALSTPALRERLRNKVSRDRKGIEIKDMLSRGYPEVAVSLLIDTGIFEDLLADATAESGRSARLSPVTMNQNSKYHDLNWAEHTKALARGVARKYRGKDKDKVFQVMMSAMLHDAGKLDSSSRQQKDDGTTTYHGHEDVSKEVAEEFMRFVKLEPFSKKVENLVGAHMRPHFLNRYDSNKQALRRFIRQMSEQGIDWDDVVNLAAADAVAKGQVVDDGLAESYEKLLTEGSELVKGMEFNKGTGVKSVVNGKDIMDAFGIKAGPEVGKLLQSVKDMMDENPAITREEALENLRSHVPSGKDKNWLDRGLSDQKDMA